MSQESIDYKTAEAVLRTKRNPVIPRGARLDKAFFEWCSKDEFGAVEIMSLFPKSSDKGSRYPCDVQCPACQQWRVQELPKKAVARLIAAAKFDLAPRDSCEFECASCAKLRKEELERSYDPEHSRKYFEKLEVEEREKARQRTPKFIETFLDPRRKWNVETSDETRFFTITRERIDPDLLGVAIRQMPKQIFLETPYWVAVRGEAVRRAGGRCSLCAGSGPLSFHFRNGENFGHQHTEEGLREILCLCERCRNTHVLKAAPPPN